MQPFRHNGSDEGSKAPSAPVQAAMKAKHVQDLITCNIRM